MGLVGLAVELVDELPPVLRGAEVEPPLPVAGRIGRFECEDLEAH